MRLYIVRFPGQFLLPTKNSGTQLHSDIVSHHGGIVQYSVIFRQDR